MRVARRVAAVTAAGSVGALLLAGCGGAAPQSAVRAKVEQFAHAAAHHQYATICRQVLAPTLLADLARSGVGCEQAMQIALSSAHDPHLVVGNITVAGQTATVLAVSQAEGEKTLLTTLRLTRTINGWRIASLGGAGT